MSAETGTNGYAVPAGGGVITAWKTQTGPQAGTMKLKVFRPTGVPGEFLSVGEEGPHSVAANTAPTFASGVRIPVQAGDMLGLVGAGLNCESEYMATKTGYKSQVFPMGVDPAPGTTATIEGNSTGFALEIAAIVEPDADHDGYGDETQDACPADATAHTFPCPVPTPAPPGPAPTPDSPPVLTLSSRAKQAALKSKAVIVAASANEAVTFRATGSVAVPGGGAFSLIPTSAAGAPSAKVKLPLGIPKVARAKIRAALRAGKKVRANVHVVATDSAGQTSNAGQAVMIVSPPPKRR
ncbi:MAG: hypothetical protein JST31_11225 [Actinobacteria bacterium]|nr:hypothetical protein [Actinomycetota bacterium]